ncbi:MAG TPA: TetR/AcrR family transcriptional regulator [Propionibacteriaceae bacterium]|nr:TetR/AcrR family transcriptional regulator [Propionibacteriaceae bacterium]
MAKSEHRGRVAGRAGGRAPRGNATTEALRGAVRRMLEELGYQALTMEGVAARSGVAKTSIYRRWPSKAEMVFDLMLHSSDELPPLEDQGSLADDIDVLAGRIVALVAGPLGRRIFPGLIGDAAGDPALLERLRNTIVLDGRKQIAQVLEHSVRRGELADTKAVPDLQAVLIGTVLMFVLFEPEMDDGLLRNKIADLAMTVLSGGPSGV